MKKLTWWRFAYLAMLLAVVAASVWLVTLRGVYLNEAVYNEINVGMPLNDVLRLIKAPPDDSGAEQVECNIFMWKEKGKGCKAILNESRPLSSAAMRGSNTEGKALTWRGRNRTLVVVVDAQEKVTQVGYLRLTTAPKDWGARCRYWFDTWFEAGD